MHLSFLLLSSLLTAASALRLTVLHTNDLHSRFDEITVRGSACRDKDRSAGKCFGGVARIKHMADKIRREEENVVMVNAGDFFQGTVWYSMFKWRIVANLTSTMGYTATSLGNHELDDGVQDLVRFIDATDAVYPNLACNLDLRLEPELQSRVKHSVVVPLADDRKTRVGVVGFVTPDTKDLASTGEIRFLEEVASIRKEVQRLKRNGVQIIIAVGHSGFEKDIEIAQQVNDLDLVVGGHTNTLLYSGENPLGESARDLYPTMVTQPSTGRIVPVVQTSGYGKYLGRLDLEFNSAGEVVSAEGNPIVLSSEIPEDSTLKGVVQLYRRRVDEKMEVEVGVASDFIDGGRPKCRLEECEFGDLVTDAMANEMEVEIALINSGAIKESFERGSITMGDVVRAMPWSNTVDVVRIPGHALLEALEHSVAQYDASSDDPNGKFLQLSGLKVTFDVDRSPGNRVVQAQTSADGKDIQGDRDYSVAVLSFMVKGGDGYEMIKDNLLEHRNTGFLDNDLLVSYIKKSTPLTVPEGGRIAVIAAERSLTAAGERETLSVFVSIILGWIPLIMN